MTFPQYDSGAALRITFFLPVSQNTFWERDNDWSQLPPILHCGRILQTKNNISGFGTNVDLLYMLYVYIYAAQDESELYQTIISLLYLPKTLAYVLVSVIMLKLLT